MAPALQRTAARRTPVSGSLLRLQAAHCLRGARPSASAPRRPVVTRASADAVSPFASKPSPAARPAAPQQPGNEPLQSYTTHKWAWTHNGKTHTINYATAGCGEPILLIHGFGASVGHYKKNIAELSKRYKVYAVDLLGFGDSDKAAVPYSMEVWRDQLLAFIDEFVCPSGKPVVLVGNSIGSLAAMMVASSLPASRLRGTVLLNSAGAMNNKGVVSDWRIILALPIFWLIDFLLSTPPVARFLFDKFRTRDNIRNVLKEVYRNQAAVDDDLVEMLYKPSCDDGALEVFCSVITGPPGPKPWDLLPKIAGPMLVLWGDKDPFTPVDGPVGRLMRGLPNSRPDTAFVLLEDVGHCPHDDRPEKVHAELLPWLERVMATPRQAPPAAGAGTAPAAAS